MCTDKKRKQTWIKNIVNIYRVLHRTVYIHIEYIQSSVSQGALVVVLHFNMRHVKQLHVGHIDALAL